MSGIRFENIWKFFDGNPVVTDLNLNIREGEFIVLVGPSGCGKTTSLRMLAGLERPSHGRIWIGDRDVTDVPTGERDISMVFQSYALYPNMNVYKNLAFGPRVRKEPKGDLEQADQRGCRPSPDTPPAKALPGSTLGRPAPARGARTGADPRAARLSHGRAALQPRRRSARPDALRAHPPPSSAGGDDDRLRHP